MEDIPQVISIFPEDQKCEQILTLTNHRLIKIFPFKDVERVMADKPSIAYITFSV